MLRSIVILFAIGLATANGKLITKAHRNGDTSKYYLYNSANPNGETLQLGDSSDLFGTKTVSVIVHGHEKSHQEEFIKTLTHELLYNADGSLDDNIDIIVVDWSIYSSLSYSNAMIMVPMIGSFIAGFLKSHFLRPENTHLIGFDLGAHIVGFAGDRFTDTKIARITALDPSESSQMLTKNHAAYVEVIYTDTEGNSSIALGDNIGHMNFYPNGGAYQPGCFTSHECSHNRAWRYFAASINHDEFSANACSSMLVMTTNRCGSGAPRKMGNNDLTKIIGASDIYRVNTESVWPFV